MQRKKASNGYQRTPQKYSEPSLPSLTRTPKSAKSEDQRCAYHQKQKITNFCQCEECLLPVCPTCIKVHTEQHKQSKTNPKFQQINKVIEQIRDKYLKLDEFVKQIKKLMMQIQAEKKNNQLKIREKLLYHRGILIAEFQKSLIQMENNLIKEIVTEDQSFIYQMQNMEEQLCKIDKSISKNRSNFQSQQILKHIILYFSKRSDRKFRKQLQLIKDKCLTLTERKIIVTVNDEEIKNIVQAISKYILIEIRDFSINKDDYNQ